jgi:type II secretory pathway pseudopilin PulG
MQLARVRRVFDSCESGIGLIETLVVLAVLGTVAVVFLTGMMITSRAAFVTDETATAENLAQSQMEWVQNASYTSNASYSAAPIPGGKDYADYSANITAQPLHTPDDGIQKITVQVSRSSGEVLTLEAYKVNR